MSMPLVRMHAQRHEGDCGAAALAMCLGVSYEDALLALGVEAPTVLRSGVWFTQLQRAARKLGVTLRKKQRADFEADDGLLQVRFPEGTHHVVLLREGLIFDTDFSVYEPTDYFKARSCKPGVVLVRAE